MVTDDRSRPSRAESDQSDGLDDERRDDGGDAGGTGVEFWGLTPVRRVLHWVLVAALLAVAVVFVVGVVRQRPSGGIELFGAVCSVGFACWALLLAVQQVRAGVAVWLDPTDGSLTVFRAAGRAVRTSPSQVQRIDRGRIDARNYSPASGWPPLRLVTTHTTVMLSPFLGPASHIADAIATRNQHVQIDL